MLFTVDMLTIPNIITAIFADDTKVMAVSKVPRYVSEKLQEALKNIQEWMKKCRVKVSDTKSKLITFMSEKKTSASVTFNEHQLPRADTAKVISWNAP